MKPFDVQDGPALLKMPLAQAERKFNQMSLEDQAATVLLAPWERRQDLILLSYEVDRLVQGLPAEELFWSIKATGPRDCVHLVRFLSPGQLQFVFDLEWWEKDILDVHRAAAWMVLLFESGEEAVRKWIGWLRRHDETLLPALLRSFIDVMKRPDDMDAQEVRDRFPYFTLDEIYFIKFRNPVLQPLWGRLLALMHDSFPDLYRDLLETMLVLPGTENLEQAYRWRKSRLNDFGLPDYFDALDIYALPAAGGVRKADISEKALVDVTDGPDMAFVPTLYMGDYPALRSAVEFLKGTRGIERVLMEWVGAANKVLLVENMDFDEPEMVRASLDKVAAYLNLALETIAASSGGTPGDILEGSVLEDLVRLSNHMVRKVGEPVRRLLGNGALPPDFFCLPDDLGEYCRGLVMEHPLLWHPETGEFLPVASIGDFERASDMVSRVVCLEKIMGIIPPHWSEWEESLPWRQMNIQESRELDWEQALVTALAHWSLYGVFRIYPVRERDLPKLRSLWFNSITEIPASDLFAGLMESISQAGRECAPEADSMVSGGLARLRMEWEDLPWNVSIDGRFVASLLVELTEP